MGTKKDGSLSKKVVRIWCTPILALEAFLSLLVITVFVSFIVIQGIQDHSTGIPCFFAVLWIVIVFSMTSLRHEIFASLILDKDGVAFSTASKKREYIPYARFSHVYLGSYAHGFSGFHVTYIVLSTRYLSANQLSQANELVQSAENVKIRFSKRRYRILHEFLPIKHRLMLEREFAGLIDDET